MGTHNDGLQVDLTRVITALQSPRILNLTHPILTDLEANLEAVLCEN
jgi:hypothetical protein